MPFKNFREGSRDGQWGATGDAAASLTVEQINCGSMLRIADAMEKMTKSFDALRADRDYWRKRAEDWESKSGRLSRSTAALRGVITKIKGAS